MYLDLDTLNRKEFDDFSGNLCFINLFKVLKIIYNISSNIVLL